VSNSTSFCCQKFVFTSGIFWSRYKYHGLYRVAQLKLGQLTFLMVTFECIGKIQLILVSVNSNLGKHLEKNKNLILADRTHKFP